MLLLMAAMTGCGPEGAVPTDNPPVSQELNIAVFEGGYGSGFWEALIAKFEEDNPGVKINMQISPEIGDVIRPQIAAGNVPDLLALAINDQTGVVLSLIKDNCLLDITDVFDSPQYDSGAALRGKITAGFLESANCAPYGDGKIYLAPQNAGPMGLVYNKTLFEDNQWDIPMTWDDFFALGDRAKEQGIALFTYPGIYPEYMESILWPAIASAVGPEDFAKLQSYDVGIWGDPRVLALLGQFAKIGSGGYLLAGTAALDHAMSQTEHMHNKALFIPNGIWMETEMRDAARAEGYAFALAPPPVMKEGDTRYVMSSFEQLSIPKAARNPELARLFLRYFYTDEVLKMYADMCNAVIPTVNATSLIEGLVSDGVYSMFGAYDEPGADPLIVGFDAPPDGALIRWSDEVFYSLSGLMNGSLSVQECSARIAAAAAQLSA